MSERVLLGVYPAGSTREEQLHVLGQLLDLGVRHWVSLQDMHETRCDGSLYQDYTQKVEYLAREKGIEGVSFARIPVPKTGHVDQEVVCEILDHIEYLMHLEGKVYLHAGDDMNRMDTVVESWGF